MLRILLALSIFAAGCVPAATQEARPAAVAPAAPHVAFLQNMIAHHEQALIMTALVGERTATPALHNLARRIDISQQDEIARMRALLARIGAAGHAHAHDMPGMLTDADLAGLAAARGAAFDRLFLELMIRHHEGALLMVQQFEQAGGPADAELYQLVNHIDADQRAEIGRMRRLLTGTP